MHAPSRLESAEPGFPQEDAARRRRARRIGMLILALGTVGVPFACGEVALRLASRFGILLFDVEMWKYARALKVPSPWPGVVLQHRPNTAATLMGVRIRTDSHGFRRASPELEARREPGGAIVAVVGDSCALGWGVPEGATLSDHLEAMVNAARPPGTLPVTVVNASIGNANAAMDAARYERFVRPLRPAWVVFAFFVNDAEPDPRPAYPFWVERSVLLAVLATRVPLLVAPSFRDYQGYYRSLYAPGAPGLAHFVGSVRAFGSSLRENGVAATMLLVPEMHEPRGFGPLAPIYRQAAQLGRESGFEVVDPSEEFPPGSGAAYWVTRDDAHPNGAAQRAFAAAIMRSGAAARVLGSLDRAR
jgi:lysophospholipase L1-like esterase